jgi:hypothetical protein
MKKRNLHKREKVGKEIFIDITNLIKTGEVKDSDLCVTKKKSIGSISALCNGVKVLTIHLLDKDSIDYPSYYTKNMETVGLSQDKAIEIYKKLAVVNGLKNSLGLPFDFASSSLESDGLMDKIAVSRFFKTR